MATGYIVWDSKNKVVVSGPHATSGDATTAIARRGKHVDSRVGDKASKDQSAQFTVETVTI